MDPNQVRIQEYRDRIDEQVRRLRAEQADLALSKQALTSATREPALASSSGATAGAGDASGSVQATLQQDQAQRAYRSLYADNLAWTTGQKEAGAGLEAGWAGCRSASRAAGASGFERLRARSDVGARRRARGVEGPDTHRQRSRMRRPGGGPPSSGAPAKANDRAGRPRPSRRKTVMCPRSRCSRAPSSRPC